MPLARVIDGQFDDAATLDAAIAGRRSIRRFLPQTVPDTLITELVRAAARAPSAHNRQPWRFHVVRDEDGKAGLAKAMGDKLRTDRSRDGDDTETIEQDVARSSGRINGAGALIAVCLTLDEMDTYPDDRRNDAEYIMAVQSTAMAAQIILLKAQASGLGACWVCAPLFCPDTVRAALGLPASLRPQGLILLGWPAEQGRDRERKNLSEILTGIAVP